MAVKNNKDILFDTTLKQGEDQKYVTEVISSKMTIGYSEQGEYKYIVHNGSAVQNETYSFYLYEQKTKIWEDLFSKYDIVPKYIQGIVLANYQWELNSDCIFPYHYKGQEYDNAIQRIKNILNKIDVDTIMEHPQMDTFHKHFWLSMKENVHPTVIIKNDENSVVVDGKTIYKRKNIEIILNKLGVENGKAFVLGFVKSPIYNYMDEKPQLIGVLNGEEIVVDDLFLSVSSHYKSKALTNRFWGFWFSFDLGENDKLSFVVKIDGITYDTQFYCVKTAVFNKKTGVDKFVRNGYQISLISNDTLAYKKITEKEQYDIESKKYFKLAIPPEIKELREKIINFKSDKRIWIYSDHHAIGTDNAYLQFQHDFSKKDGVYRYYVYDGNKEEIEDNFSNEQKEYLIEYASEFHQLLYLKAEYLIVSFIDIRPRVPFTEAQLQFLLDLHQPEVIYLQHGVLHADLRWLQSAERCRADKVVVSSVFEKNNLIEKYNYRKKDILPFGMPRFDTIRKTDKPKNRIIFAPSWRSYLMNKNVDAVWEGNLGQLLKSRYLNKFVAFLKSQKLHDYLKANDLILDAKLHPHMTSIMDMFDITSDRINIIDHKVNLTDYKLFITDISSFVFDYAYLSRPIIYFMPDMEEFESGMNHYRKLDLPFEKAFGRLVTEADDAVDEIIRIGENNFVPDEVYKERMDSFFVPLDNCAEKLYNYLIKDKNA